MAITRTFTYLGELEGGGMGIEVAPVTLTDVGIGPPKHVWLCRYDILATDEYTRAAGIQWTVNGLSRITDVLALYSAAMANLANKLEFTSVTNAANAAPIIQAALLEQAGDGAALAEKPNAEAYGEEYSYFAVVAGI